MDTHQAEKSNVELFVELQTAQIVFLVGADVLLQGGRESRHKYHSYCRSVPSLGPSDETDHLLMFWQHYYCCCTSKTMHAIRVALVETLGLYQEGTLDYR